MKVSFTIQDEKKTSYWHEVEIDVLPRKGDEISLDGYFQNKEGEDVFEDKTAKVTGFKWYLFAEEEEPTVYIWLKEV